MVSIKLLLRQLRKLEVGGVLQLLDISQSPGIGALTGASEAAVAAVNNAISSASQAAAQVASTASRKLFHQLVMTIMSPLLEVSEGLNKAVSATTTAVGG